ncbi:SKP1-like protein 14 [Citrus sinensis]|uniref:SKP1-like protein 14 n=1 Tax=Citrus sinensis TaxID=2711 RepID=A0ACB8JQH1_CITSI|nr:SKP1-like protein 14 [Citrus sinensis]
MKKISLKMMDKQLFEMEESVMDNNASEDTMVLLLNVLTALLSYIIEFYKAHVEFLKKRSLKQEVKTVNNEFMKSKSNDELKEMILVANYLNIKEIVKCVKKFFRIANNFTSEEEAAKKKYEWAFECVDVANDD